MTENETILYQSWVNDLQRDLDQLRQDKRELTATVTRLEELVAEYGAKINNLLHNRGDE